MNARKHATAAVLAVALIVIAPLLFLTHQSEPAQAASAPLCSASVNGSSVHIRCVLAGTTILDTTLPIGVPGVTATVKIPGPTIRIPGPTIRLPGATVTVPGINVPGDTVTVRPPPATVTLRGTETAPAAPQATKTVTVRPNTVRPSERPTATQTTTAGASPNSAGRQTATTRATVTPTPEVKTRTETETQTKTETIVKRVLLGTLASLVLAALGIIAMLLGYYFGQKDAQRREKKFLGNLLDYTRIGKRPNQ